MPTETSKCQWLWHVTGKDHAGRRHRWRTLQPSKGAAWAWLMRLRPDIDHHTITVKVHQPGDPR